MNVIERIVERVLDVARYFWYKDEEIEEYERTKRNYVSPSSRTYDGGMGNLIIVVRLFSYWALLVATPFMVFDFYDTIDAYKKMFVFFLVFDAISRELGHWDLTGKIESTDNGRWWL